MGNGVAFYATTILVYAGVDALAVLGLNYQFGVSGVTNFGFIIFQAAGAYTAALLSLPSSSSNGGFQTYVGGLNLPFPLPWIGAAIVGGLVAVPFTFLVGRRLRGDFAAIGLLVTAVMANLLVTNYRPFLNGDAGLSLVPAPLQEQINPQSLNYQWGYGAAAVVFALLVYFFLHRITESPYGRSLRAMRENDVVADSLGKNLLALRAGTLVLGGAIAGLSGAILVGFITLWAPSAWTYAETIVLFAAVIIGGAGNHKGAILGALLVPLTFEEITRFVPSFGPPELIPALQWVAIGLLILLFIWFRPQGVLPERKRVVSLPGADGDAAGVRERGQESAAAEDWTPPPRLPAETPASPEEAPASLGASPPVEMSGSVAGPPSLEHTNGAPTQQSGSNVVLRSAELTRAFDGVVAVDRVSISAQAGHLTGLIGPNGAGKSTILAMLAGTLKPTAGQIFYHGVDITAQPAFRRARGGLVRTFQLASEFKRLTVLENLLSAVPEQPGDSFRGALRGRRYWRKSEWEAVQRATEMLERFGLTAQANEYAGDLSGGQRRLVEIMRALMAQPKVLLLDEPMAGVHPRLARRIGYELLELCREGMAIVMVEHELSLMDEFCDPVVVMAEGRVLAEGSMATLRAQPEVVEAYLVG
jgi:branched-chain amino acid transport system permease protein